MSKQDLFRKLAALPANTPGVPAAPPPELVAFVVRWNRSLRQWKQSTLASFAGVSLSTIERVERGERVSDEALDKIAQGLGYEPGYFTAPRLPITPEKATAEMVDTFGHLEPVAVRPMNTRRAIREAAQCQAILIHRPDVPETHDAELEILQEWLALASFILSAPEERLHRSERGRRKLYNDILLCIRDLERKGLSVLSGVMMAPLEQIPDWKVAIISVTPKFSDPGAVKRRHVLVDQRLVSLPPHWTAM
jgi:transcriptional regulator with XRE-family HTH domain